MPCSASVWALAEPLQRRRDLGGLVALPEVQDHARRRLIAPNAIPQFRARSSGLPAWSSAALGEQWSASARATELATTIPRSSAISTSPATCHVLDSDRRPFGSAFLAIPADDERLTLRARRAGRIADPREAVVLGVLRSFLEERADEDVELVHRAARTVLADIACPAVSTPTARGRPSSTPRHAIARRRTLLSLPHAATSSATR